MARAARRWRCSVWIPTALAEIVGARPHERQGDVYVLAPLKADAHARLVAAGLRADAPRRSGDTLRIDASVPGNALAGSGLLGPDPLIMLRSTKDMPIVRISPDGRPTVVGHWRYDLRDRNLRVEREKPSGRANPLQQGGQTDDDR